MRRVTDGAESDPRRALPRLKTAGFANATARVGVPAEQRPVLTAFTGDLWIAYAVENEAGFWFVNPRRLEGAGLSLPDLHRLALTNLRRRFAESPPRIVQDGQIFRIEADDHLAAALMLDAEFWDEGLQALGEPLLAVVPHRDLLAFTRLSSDAGREALMTLAAATDLDDTHALSQALFAYDKTGWQAYARVQ